ncbi:uncharacterized protein LY79DRAFT_663957 [Colletotrichum navitas]|uniref:Uncharacterized protein n=1 Tax=Colletotrichum navitas TaxID=681940 RepID=A0AAD8UYF2_9PEZI|nr:uncharacterized protein LY79DRAFT_663957 [Colletotrichum navitas]KAK1566000.1 hypothetical protein LY79DRAFT_663957 [Colletotrichum navitas]
MWHSLNSPTFLITALFYALVAAGRKPVRDAKTLGLTIKQQGGNHFDVSGPGKFRAYVEIDKFLDQIDVIYIGNAGRAIKAREVLLSVWKESSGTSASKLRRIMYDVIQNDETVSVLDSIWKAREIDDGKHDSDDDYGDSYNYGSHDEGETDGVIEPTITVTRPPPGEEDWRFSDLRDKTPFGIGAAKMCLEYTEMENHFIKSFTFGRNKEDGKWLVINFGTGVISQVYSKVVIVRDGRH